MSASGHGVVSFGAMRYHGQSPEREKRERPLDSQSTTTIKNQRTDSAKSISAGDQWVCGREGCMLQTVGSGSCARGLVPTHVMIWAVCLDLTVWIKRYPFTAQLLQKNP